MIKSSGIIAENNLSITLNKATAVVQPTTANSIMPDNSNQITNIDNVQTQSSDNKDKTIQKTTLKEICNTLNSYLNKYGFTIKEDEIEKVFKEVLNSEIVADKLKVCLRFILPALEKFKNNKNVTLEQVLQQAKDWHIAINQGKWSSIEAYEQAQQSAINTYGKPEGIVERMKRVGPCKDIRTLSSPEEQKAAINDYVKWLLDDAKKNGGKNPANYVSRDLTRLIINTKDDRIRGLFFEVIDGMVESDSYKDLIKDDNNEIAMNAIIATVHSYRDQDQLSEDIVKYNVAGKVSRWNLGQGNTTIAIACLGENITSETDARTFNSQIDETIIHFWEENKDILASISQKYIEAGQNGVEPELTPEEQQVYNEFQNKCVALRAGQNIGLTNNENLPPEIKTLLFNEIQVADTDKELLQREALAYTQHLIQENPDIINMSVEDFEKFMDEVTNGNYSIVKNDIANGTYTELNPPKAESEASGTSSIEETSETQAEEAENSYKNTPVGGLGYNNTPEPPSANPTEKLETILEKQDKAVTNPQQSQTPVTKAPTDIIDAVRTGSLKEYKEATRKTEQELTKELLNGDKTTIEIGKELFAKFNKNTQELIFATLNNRACSAVLDLLSFIQLRKVEGNDYYMQTIIEEKRREAEEKNKTGFEANV